MSALAVMLKKLGHEVSGWDENLGRGVQVLLDNGIDVDLPFEKISKLKKQTKNGDAACRLCNEAGDAEKNKNAKNTRKRRKNATFLGLEKLIDCDLVVQSSAIKEDDFHIVLAKKLGKKIISRGQLLGWVSSNYEKVIAMAGSHGKTTTTAMIFNILRVAGKEPTLHLGGFKIDDNLNYAVGGQEFFVTEACEYHDNFLFLRPYLSVVTNVEPEHLDFFRTFEREQESFRQFEENSENVINSTADYFAKNICHDRFGGLMFSLFCKEEKIMDLHLKICEEINVQNCIYAYLVAKKLGIEDCFIKQGLENFKGVHSRFERKTCASFDNVICDYAHHPTEISKAIFSAQKIFSQKPLVVVFQPHTFSRTKTLLSEFLKVFDGVENLILFKTYAARERESDGISARKLTQILQKNGKNAAYFDNFALLKEHLHKFPCDTTLLFLGAGDLPQIMTQDGFVT